MSIYGYINVNMYIFYIQRIYIYKQFKKSNENKEVYKGDFRGKGKII